MAILVLFIPQRRVLPTVDGLPWHWARRRQCAHRQRRRGLPIANQIPVAPRPHVENAGRGMLQHFAMVVLADDPAQRLQVLDPTEHHDVR
jgi:hypothetical protein